jgi:hypothetical protein
MGFRIRFLFFFFLISITPNFVLAQFDRFDNPDLYEPCPVVNHFGLADLLMHVVLAPITNTFDPSWDDCFSEKNREMIELLSSETRTESSSRLSYDSAKTYPCKPFPSRYFGEKVIHFNFFELRSMQVFYVEGRLFNSMGEEINEEDLQVKHWLDQIPEKIIIMSPQGNFFLVNKWSGLIHHTSFFGHHPAAFSGMSESDRKYVGSLGSLPVYLHSGHFRPGPAEEKNFRERIEELSAFKATRGSASPYPYPVNIFNIQGVLLSGVLLVNLPKMYERYRLWRTERDIKIMNRVDDKIKRFTEMLRDSDGALSPSREWLVRGYSCYKKRPKTTVVGAFCCYFLSKWVCSELEF